MDTVTLPLAPINPQVHQAIEDICSGMVEIMPSTQEYIAERDQLLAAIDGKVERKTRDDIGDLYLNLATHFGVEMFRLGLAIGRNPEIMFDLPAATTTR